ncbi:peptidoglycan-binding protein [Kaustia mangrovi]|uniref:Peptidoglycan-binding protein n=1 Tax=Kaustia mangrovi TaxID=2593653 RepID=A0A7S8C143_9HYPH|nr:peptidoglycan-binding protein [Kaustia mangrovi]QPC41450.1 peptidoglycan-binding protein [Kaustia mangrovi]
MVERWYRRALPVRKSGRQGIGFGALTLLVLGAALPVAGTSPASAQSAGDFPAREGVVAVTGFSGTVAPGNDEIPPGRTALDETVIDPDGGSLKLFDVSAGKGPPHGQLIGGEPVLSVPARTIGQVFGLALDDAEVPNIYAGASSAFGLQIVAPGDNGRAVRVKAGQPDAAWMTGQFGAGGGPGSVWRIDGRTGDVSLFATVSGPDGPNSGPGLGNLAYDADHQQLYVSDLDTGLIHRLDLSGLDLGTFDHGVAARPAAGLEPAADDTSARADIASPAFNAENPATWGLTAPERRIWGLAYHSGRLYYAVWQGPEVWSVSIGPDGSFGDDPRREVAVPGDPRAYPVSDIAFDGEGGMILAQRGDIRSRYDYSIFALPRRTRVLRYEPAGPEGSGRWSTSPETYAIGFPATSQNASGGVSLGYGYDASGDLDTESCFATVWATGDALRQSASERAELMETGPTTVHGAQAVSTPLTEPRNMPPWTSYFLDYDGRFEDPNSAGHVGDIEAVTRCPAAPATRMAEAPSEPEAAPEPEPEQEPAAEQDMQTEDAQPQAEAEAEAERKAEPDGAQDDAAMAPETEAEPEAEPESEPAPDSQAAPASEPEAPVDERARAPDLAVTVRADADACEPGAACSFTVVIANEGGAAYSGQLAILDRIEPAGARLADASPDPWSCVDLRSEYVCIHPDATLEPDETAELRLDIRAPRGGSGSVRNCSQALWNGATLRARIAAAQAGLNERGLSAGPVDGIMGSKTRSAIEAFRSSTELPAGGEVDEELMAALYGRWGVGDLDQSNDSDCAVPGEASREAPAPPPASDEPQDTAMPEDAPTPEDTQAACTGGQIRDADTGQCACPSGKPVWNAAKGTCVADTAKPETATPALCRGGQVWSEPKSQCVCPPTKPRWNETGQRCEGA